MEDAIESAAAQENHAEPLRQEIATVASN